MFDLRDWFIGGTILGLLASCWRYVNIFFWRIINLLIVRIRLHGDASVAFGYYCWENLKHTKYGEKEYDGFYTYVQPVGRNQLVGFQKVGRDFIIFWEGWKPLVIYWDMSKESHLPSPLTVLYLRGMFNEDELVAKAIEAKNERAHKGSHLIGRRFQVHYLCGYSGKSRRRDGPPLSDRNETRVTDIDKDVALDRRYLTWTIDQLGAKVPEIDPFTTLALPSNARDVIEEIRRWMMSEDWYKEKIIPWRMGVLLHGKPGTGKSSVIRALGCHFDLPIYAFDLSNFANDDFVAAWGKVLANTPCIVAIEDIDAVFDGRTNKLGEHGGGLTFDCLLNCISGVKEAEGVLVILTTNHPEVLDEALGRADNDRGGISTRPGRIDCVLELGPLDETCRRQIAERILSDCTDKIEAIVQEGNGDTGAQFQNRCQTIALEWYWSQKGSENGQNGKTWHRRQRPEKPKALVEFNESPPGLVYQTSHGGQSEG